MNADLTILCTLMFMAGFLCGFATLAGIAVLRNRKKGKDESSIDTLTENQRG